MRRDPGVRPAARAALERSASPPPGTAVPTQRTVVDAAWFEAGTCRNCGAALGTPYCAQCGQQKAARFSWRDLRHEAWERWRLFEAGAARTLWRLVSRPGYVAREYVLGRRKDHMHPLKLLLVLVALTVLVLGYGQVFSHYSYSLREDAKLLRMAELVQGYANWSFSTGIFAIFLASWLGYRRRLGYNLLEHAVLAVYCQIVVLLALIVSLLPTLVWQSPGFVSAYTDASKWVMYPIRILVVGLAFHQFFLVDLRREWLRLGVSVLLYAAASLLLLRLYAYVILRIVQFQTS